jgi:hypothetical protein
MSPEFIGQYDFGALDDFACQFKFVRETIPLIPLHFDICFDYCGSSGQPFAQVVSSSSLTAMAVYRELIRVVLHTIFSHETVL